MAINNHNAENKEEIHFFEISRETSEKRTVYLFEINNLRLRLRQVKNINLTFGIENIIYNLSFDGPSQGSKFLTTSVLNDAEIYFKKYCFDIG